MKKQLIMFTVLLGFWIYNSGCKKTESPVYDNIWMQNITFMPNAVTMPANTTITWSNNDTMVHNATGDQAWFASGKINLTEHTRISLPALVLLHTGASFMLV
jgi:hypothetical protein